MKKKLKKLLKLDGNKGDVIILVILVLLLIFLFTSTMLILFNLWAKTTTKIIFGKEAKNFSKIGIENAIWEIDKDNREYDAFSDNWRLNFEGEEVDLNNDGESDAKWFYIKDRRENIIGRYAVLVEDESGKVNINAVGNLKASFNEGHSCFEINIFEKLLGKFLYWNIVNFRYGGDGKPGKANFDDDKDMLFSPIDGIDNDGDGFVDEPDEGFDEDDEFYYLEPKGDDRPFFSPSEIKLVAGFGEKNYQKIRNFITCFSYDRDLNKNEEERIDINKASLVKLIDFFKKMGYKETQAIQISLNIVDFRDKDSIPTVYEYMTGIEETPYLNEIDAVMPWERKVLPNKTIIIKEEVGQFIEIFNPYSKPINIGGWKIKGICCLFSNDWDTVEKKSGEIYDDVMNGETEIDQTKVSKIQNLLSRFTTVTIKENTVIPPYSFYTIGDNLKIVVVVTFTSSGVPIVVPLFFPSSGVPENCQQYERIIAINPGSLGFLGEFLSRIDFFEN
ncbi:MAG: lamin tail domain-containing protein, partial [bacterium]|nr:lamin tail domain-containing protein [bacterium]